MGAAALPSLLLGILFVSSFTISPSESKLTTDYYSKSCPQFEDTIREIVTSKQITSPTTAAGTLRLFFHDCMVEGCDASVLISSNAFNKAERDSDVNLSLPGDAFDLIVRAKTALELTCPGVVSCADILAHATRDLITMVGGPFYTVRLGRKDGLISQASRVDLPTVKSSVSEMITFFASKGFTVIEFVALMGGHTIGFSHCKEFAGRIYNYSKTSPIDPTLNAKYAEGLRKACANYETNPTMAAFNDVMTPGKFDNMYYQNLQRGLGLLQIDQILMADARTKPYVEMFAANQTAFFQSFSHAMEKLSVLSVKTGRKGEIRRRCDSFNNIRT
ncbi:PREDICTED: peroxidase 41-like [Nelumbo nucifera]|uniref:Peroxidase n=1 Tax=Nelumbo nucifera TaxID=4432 RepID=A0A1U8AVN1_NELNU|nr:PREDICTED: peroxidase 41-like [Nelumbo nucifera]